MAVPSFHKGVEITNRNLQFSSSNPFHLAAFRGPCVKRELTIVVLISMEAHIGDEAHYVVPIFLETHMEYKNPLIMYRPPWKPIWEARTIQRLGPSKRLNTSPWKPIWEIKRRRDGALRTLQPKGLELAPPTVVGRSGSSTAVAALYLLRVKYRVRVNYRARFLYSVQKDYAARPSGPADQQLSKRPSHIACTLHFKGVHRSAPVTQFLCVRRYTLLHG